MFCLFAGTLPAKFKHFYTLGVGTIPADNKIKNGSGKKRSEIENKAASHPKGGRPETTGRTHPSLTGKPFPPPNRTSFPADNGYRTTWSDMIFKDQI